MTKMRTMKPRFNNETQAIASYLSPLIKAKSLISIKKNVTIHRFIRYKKQ